MTAHRYTTIDAHAAGEPLRLITSGVPEIPGTTLLEKRAWASTHLDAVRRHLLWEPRGHRDMYGAMLCDPVTPDGHVGVLFLHNAGWSTMCGHGIIAVTTLGLAHGLFPHDRHGDQVTIRFDTPAGRVHAVAEWDGHRVRQVRFRNVPSFVSRPHCTVQVPGLGAISGDVAFGGAFYFYVPIEAIDCSLAPSAARELADLGMRLTQAVREQVPLDHPDDPDLAFLYGTIFYGRGTSAPWREVCVFADGQIDRSPTGTGVSGLASILHARGTLQTGGPGIDIEGILGTRFSVRILEEHPVAAYQAVVPEVGGSAWITGAHEFLLEDGDPLGGGFLLG